MTVKELRERLSTFERDLQAHQELWLHSLDDVMPDFPIRNGDALRNQMRSLARQLGALRGYIDRFAQNTIMYFPALGQEWDVFESAVGNDVAQRKGHSLEGALQQLQAILGRLDALPDPAPVPGDKPEVAPHPAPGPRAAEDREKAKRVWVVHGRDERLRKGMFDFLYSIGLKPLEFSKAREHTGKPTPYVKEILDAAFRHAQAVVVMLTPDDEARLRPGLVKTTDPGYERELTLQARPNVIFEAGMAAVSHQDRTVIAKFGELRPFSDLAGLHVVDMDGSIAQREELARRLETAGCPVDLGHRHWHTAGDLGPTIHR